MAWVRLDDKRAISSKLRAAGMAATGLDSTAICWSSHQEKDGFISREDVEMLANLYGCSDWESLAKELVKVDRWKWDGRRKGWVIQGFLDYNLSHADLETRRARDRERKRSRLRGDSDSARNPGGTDSES